MKINKYNRRLLLLAVTSVFFLTTTLALMFAGRLVVTDAKLHLIDQCRFEVYGSNSVGYSIRLFNFTYSSAGAECVILRDTCSLNNVDGLDCNWITTTKECECWIGNKVSLSEQNETRV